MSEIIYRALGSPAIKNIVSDLKKASSVLGIDFFGIGALARNVWYLSNDMTARGTKDVDFAVYVPTQQVYIELKDLLVREFGYQNLSTNSFCLASPYGLPLDLLPFGEIGNNDKVTVEGTGLVTINLQGFPETYLYGLVEAELESDKIKICTVPSVILLKLIAFDDRPENRPNDPADISSIMKHYPDLEAEKIWDEYGFLYTDDLEHEEVGIKVLGHEISKIIKKNEQLTQRIKRIVTDGITGNSKLAEKMILDSSSETVADKQNSLSILLTGINEGLKNY